MNGKGKGNPCSHNTMKISIFKNIRSCYLIFRELIIVSKQIVKSFLIEIYIRSYILFREELCIKK